MLRYQKIDVSEGTDVNKTSVSKEYDLCHYWFFKDIGLKFKEDVCNKCHDLLMIPYSLKNIAILNAKGNYYWFNRPEILQKAKENYSREKAAEYYKQNKEAVKEKAKEHYKNLSQEKKRQN